MTNAGCWIERYYDRESQNEWERLDRHRTEFAVTQRAMLDHLPPPPARVLDCGGGPGRYAVELARRGYAVTLFDLSGGNLRLARDKAKAAGVQLAAYEQGTALDLSRFGDEAFDGVLLMGPLYHLLEADERRQALLEARRVLRPGGPLFAAFITRYAPFRYCAAHETDWPVNEPEFAESFSETGILPPRGEANSAFVAYCAHPTEVGPLIREVGLDLVALLGVEGLVSMIEEGVNALDGSAWETWVDLNHHVAADPSVHGAVEHLLAVAIKPRWRAVLRAIARCLNEAGVPFKVVGGTALALHGVTVSVHDLDLEMDAPSAYRFQELYAAYATQPVSWTESDAYRSHFGRFEIRTPSHVCGGQRPRPTRDVARGTTSVGIVRDGVTVEVMGDLSRREGDTWTPTMTSTTITIDLDGVPVRTSWLEEETLACIRRGRLERAAQCLPYCDHAKLMCLLRGDLPTNVL